MPIGAFLSAKKILTYFTHDPMLGHLTTFGGHPVSCAAGHAAISIIQEEKLIEEVAAKADFLRKSLVHPAIYEIRNAGLLMAVELQPGLDVIQFVRLAFEAGILTDTFLFDARSFRIAPPLTITFDEIAMICEKLKIILQRFL
jgi:acetylornithine/succinyldiaminopimelate/putrescine aminotransferase